MEIEEAVIEIKKLELSVQSMTSEEEQSDQTYERTYPHGNDFSEEEEESQLEFVDQAKNVQTA